MLDYRKKIQFFHHTTFEQNQSTKKLLILDRDLRICRRKYNREFFEKWEMAFKAYVEGRWRDAKEKFEKTMTYLGWEDGPSKTIYEYMENQHFRSP